MTKMEDSRQEKVIRQAKAAVSEAALLHKETMEPIERDRSGEGWLETIPTGRF